MTKNKKRGFLKKIGFSDNPVNHRFLQKARKIMYNCVFMLMENV